MNSFIINILNFENKMLMQKLMFTIESKVLEKCCKEQLFINLNLSIYFYQNCKTEVKVKQILIFLDTSDTKSMIY